MSIQTHTITAMLMSTVAATATFADEDFNSKPDTKHFDELFIGGEFGTNFTNTFAPEQSGFYYGGLAGFRKQTNTDWVFGLEGAFATTDRAINRDARGAIYTLDFDHQWSVAATVGKTFGADGRNLVFGKVGYNRQRYDSDVPERLRQFFDPSIFPEITNLSDDGLQLGIGYERAFSDRLNLRLTVDYVDADFFNQWQPKIGFILKF